MRSAKSASAWVDIKITTGPPPRWCSARRRARSNPLSPPSVMSTRTTSGRSSSARRSASAEVAATPTTRRPCRSRRPRAASRNNRLSSTMRTPNAMRTESQRARRRALRLAGIRGIRALAAEPVPGKDIAPGGKVGSVLRGGRPRGGRRRWTWGAPRCTRTRCASAPATSARLGRCSTGVREASAELCRLASAMFRSGQPRPSGRQR